MPAQLLDLQRTAGNNAVAGLLRAYLANGTGNASTSTLPPAAPLMPRPARQRDLQQPPLQDASPAGDIARQSGPADQPTTASDNPLEGLHKHDGFKNDPDKATNKPRVHKLQVKLNSKEGAHLSTDGAFGDKTMTVLIEYMEDIGKSPDEIQAVNDGDDGIDQVTADALMDRAPRPPQPTPPQPNPPQPTPPTPSPGDPVTQNELLVLTKYQFMEQTERDATEDAVRDLKPLDPIQVPFLTSVMEAVAVGIIQFTYGAFEQVLRSAIKSRFPAPNPTKPAPSPSAADITDNAADKASDFLEDFGKDGLTDAISKEHQKPVAALEAQVEAFRRVQLASLRQGYLQLSVKWIKEVHADPNTKDITADDLQKLAEGLDEKGNDIYKLRYINVLQAWDAYIAQKGGGPNPKQETVVGPDGKPVINPATGKPERVSVTSLPQMDDSSDPQKNAGVVFVRIFSSNVRPKLATTKIDPSRGDDIFLNGVQVDENEIHVFGMSETTRQQLAADSPTLQSLHMPIVFRGDPVDGGEVAFARDEAGVVRDISSDAKGTAWLKGVGQDFNGSPDPDSGARALFSGDAGGPVLDLQSIDTGKLQGS